MKMFTFANAALAAVAAVALTAAPASADIIGATGTFTYARHTGYYAGTGGEFTITVTSGPISNASYDAAAKNVGGDGTFQTFCLEVGENAASPSNYVVASATTQGADPVSMGTAWLYSQFATGALGNSYYANRAAHVALLQEAIWALEHEAGHPAPTGNWYYDQALLNGGTADATVGYLGVYVLNNTNANGGVAQDFLYYQAPPVTTPDGGATLALLGGALMALGAARRRFTN